MSEDSRVQSLTYLLLVASPILTLVYVLVTGISARTPVWGQLVAYGFPVGAVIVFVSYYRWAATSQDRGLFLRCGSLAGLVVGPLYAFPGVSMTLQQQAVGIPLLNADVLVVEMWLGGSIVGLGIGHLYASTQAEKRRLERREEQLEQQRQQLTVLNRVLRHDIRTEVDLILSAVATLSEERGESAQLDEIEDRCWKIAEIGDNARYIERMMDDAAGPTTTTDVTEVVEEAAMAVRSRSEAVTVDLEMPAEALVVTNGLVATAVENLLTNAVEHNDTAAPAVEVTVEQRHDEVQVRVADNGPGIPEQEREVFETFEETRFQHSSGLGLWLVHWIVTGLSGSVQINERQPRGTVVTLRVPRAPAETDQVSRAVTKA